MIKILQTLYETINILCALIFNECKYILCPKGESFEHPQNEGRYASKIIKTILKEKGKMYYAVDTSKEDRFRILAYPILFFIFFV